MKERNGQLREHTLKHIAAQRGAELGEIKYWAIYLSEKKGLSKAEVYRRLIAGYGVDKPHDSGKPDNEMRDGGKHHAAKISGRRDH